MKAPLRNRVGASALALTLVLAACGSDDDDGSPEVDSTDATEETTGATEAPAATDAPESTEGADTAAGGVPEGATIVEISGDLANLDGTEVGIANLAPVPGAERWSRPLEECLVANGATVDFQDVGGDPTKLPAILDGWEAAGKQAVFNIGIDMTGQESTIARFVDAGVPFVTWGAGNPAGVVALDANQVEDGRIIARYVADQIGGAGSVVLVNANNPALQSREEGIQEVFAEFPDIELTIVGDALGFSAEAAQTATEAALQADPDVVAVIGGFGSLGVGAATAVDAAGSDAIVVSMNGDPEEYEAIRSGGPFVATVADGHEYGGEAACQIAAAMLGGEPAPGGGEPIFATSVLVTADNVPAEGEIEPTPRQFYQID
jgi:ABC-type sugar transport system substrate-binding protein